MIAASALRFAVGRALGWNRLRSDAYEVGLRNGNLVFDGHGHGHGVGLCQSGATEMASEGRDARAILSFYFPGTVLRITPRDEGWHETDFGALTLRSGGVLSSEQDAAWRSWFSEHGTMRCNDSRLISRFRRGSFLRRLPKCFVR